MEKQVLGKEVLPQQCPRRVVLQYLFLLNWVTIIVFNATMFFHRFSDPPYVMGFLSFILPSFTLSQPFLSHQHLPAAFSGNCKAEHHCSGITSTLMRPES